MQLGAKQLEMRQTQEQTNSKRARGESVFALEPFADLKQPENTPEVGV